MTFTHYISFPYQRIFLGIVDTITEQDLKMKAHRIYVKFIWVFFYSRLACKWVGLNKDFNTTRERRIEWALAGPEKELIKWWHTVKKNDLFILRKAHKLHGINQYESDPDSDHKDWLLSRLQETMTFKKNQKPWGWIWVKRTKRSFWLWAK